MVQLRFLGSGNAFCPDGRLHSLLMIDDEILIDCPPTILPQLQRVGLNPSDVKSLLITHWHGDHIFGFPFLILERKYISDRAAEHHLDVHLHPGGEERLSHLAELAYPGTLIDSINNSVSFHNTPRGEVRGVNGWSFERFEVFHVPETDPHGYQLTHESGFSMIHCGDSGPCPEISKRAGGVDVVVIEVGIPDGVPTEMHFKPSTIRDLALRNPKTTFLATHLFTKDGETIPNLPDNVIQVQDEMTFEWQKGEFGAFPN